MPAETDHNSSALSQTEIHRTAAMHASPLRYFQRRVEHATLIDDHHYAMRVTQQFVIPRLTTDPSDTRTESIVSLGWFAKDRLPDIQVHAEDGTTLPFLRRMDQGKIGAALFAAKWKQTFFSNLCTSVEEADRTWLIIHESIERVLTSARKSAQVVIYSLRQYLRERSTAKQLPRDLRCFILAIVAEDAFWLSLKSLAEVRLLFTRMDSIPSRTYVVTTLYTERFYDRLPPPRSISTRTHVYRSYRRRKPGDATRRVGRAVLGWLGASSIGLVRTPNNLGGAASYWTIFTTPEGIEPVRCFWETGATKLLSHEIVSVDDTKAALGKHHAPGEPVVTDKQILDVQIAPSSAMFSAAGLAILLFLVGVFVFKAMPQLTCEHIYHSLCDHSLPIRATPPANVNTDYLTGLLGIGALLAATPAAIAGALAYRGHTFVRRASRGPRIMLAVLSGQAALLAVVMGVHGAGGFAEWLSYLLAITALTLAGIFTYIRFGWRWRQTERSRRPVKAKSHPPYACRGKQARYATFSLLPWLFVVTATAALLVLFQYHTI
jgi:hypothetical protein